MNRTNRVATNTVFVVFSIIAFFLGDRAAVMYQAYMKQPDAQPFDAVAAVSNQLLPDICVRPFFFGLDKVSLQTGLVFAAVIGLIWVYFVFAEGNRRPGEEYGSARWGTLREASRFANHKNPQANIILSKHIRMNTEPPKDFELERNLNVCYIAGSGGGKTTRSVWPNAWQYNSSCVFTDAKANLLPKLGQGFLDEGYRVSAFNTIDFGLSMHYNPLRYIEKEEDILNIVNVLMENTSGTGKQKNEDFWTKSERMWLQAHIGYLLLACRIEERNFGSVLLLLRNSIVKEENENYVNPVDILFEELEARLPGNFACECYALYKLSAGKTAKSILESVAIRLSPFNIPALREITSYDEMDLDAIGTEKTALFIGVSPTNTTYDFLVAMLLYQLIDRLMTEAAIKYGGELPIRVQLFLDEFANCIGKIPNFEKTISVIREAKINAWIYLQSLSQLEALYGKAEANTILNNCDWTVFGGGKSTDTTKQLSEMLGKETLRGKNNTENKGHYGGYSIQDQGLGRELLDPSEIGRLSRGKCLIHCTGQYPFIDDKYPTFRDKRYRSMKKLDVRKWLEERKADSNDPLDFLKNCQVVGEINIDTGEATFSPEVAAAFRSISE